MRLFAPSELSEKQETNLASRASLAAGERILLFHDETVLDSGKAGLLVTDLRVVRFGSGGALEMPRQQITEVVAEFVGERDDDFYVVITSSVPIEFPGSVSRLRATYDNDSRTLKLRLMLDEATVDRIVAALQGVPESEQEPAPAEEEEEEFQVYAANPRGRREQIVGFFKVIGVLLVVLVANYIGATIENPLRGLFALSLIAIYVVSPIVVLVLIIRILLPGKRRTLYLVSPTHFSKVAIRDRSPLWDATVCSFSNVRGLLPEFLQPWGEIQVSVFRNKVVYSYFLEGLSGKPSNTETSGTISASEFPDREAWLEFAEALRS